MNRSIICLDQNAWIQLARIFYGNDGDPSVAKLPTKMFELANQGSHVFPISFERLHETQKISNVERRKRLARFMIDLSDGFTIGPADKRTIPLECYNYLVDLHCLPKLKYDIGEEIIGKGISGIFGARGELIPNKPDAEPIPVDRRKEIIDYFNSNEVLFDIISGKNEELRRSSLETIKSIHDEGRRKMEKNLAEIPSGMDKRKRHLGALSNFLMDSILPIMTMEALKLGIPFDGSAKPKSKIKSPEEFLRQIPSAYVSFELSHARDKQCCGKVMENDFNDISFLSYAIPYASVVVTERTWVQIAKRLKLDTLYGSVIISVSEMGAFKTLLALNG